MALKTLLELRNLAKDKANMENSDFVLDPQWNSYINYAISDLRDKIISKAGEDYFAKSANIALISNQEDYALPADFYKCLWMELLLTNGKHTKIHRYEVSEQNQYSDCLTPQVAYLKYRLRADNVTFQPVNNYGGRTIRLWYVPTITELALNGDTLNGYNGWEEYVIVSAAIKALVKEESDTTDLDKELAKLNLRIEQMAPNRDQGQPMRIYDNSRQRSFGDLPWP